MNRIEKIIEFLQANPKDNFLRHALALEYIKMNDEEKAKQLFIDILTETPNYIGSYYHLAKLHERLNETDEAMKRYEQGMIIARQLKDNHAYNELQAAYDDLI